MDHPYCVREKLWKKRYDVFKIWIYCVRAKSFTLSTPGAEIPNFSLLARVMDGWPKYWFGWKKTSICVCFGFSKGWLYRILREGWKWIFLFQRLKSPLFVLIPRRFLFGFCLICHDIVWRLDSVCAPRPIYTHTHIFAVRCTLGIGWLFELHHLGMGMGMGTTVAYGVMPL